MRLAFARKLAGHVARRLTIRRRFRIGSIEDAVDGFGPDHLLIGLRAGEKAGWQEKGLLDDIERRFAIPMTVFQLPFDRRQ
jgi:hypothetical protein